MGFFASLLSATFAASKDLVSKRLSRDIDGTTSTFASFAFAIPFYLLALSLLWSLGLPIVTATWMFFGLVFLRSTTDALAEGMKMHAFGYGDISLVATFFSVSPLILLIVSPLVTRDPLSIPGALAVLLSVGGSLLLVYRPSSKSWASQKKGILLALGASFFFALNSCFDRLAVQQDQQGVGTAVYAGFAMTILSALLLAPSLFGAGRISTLWSSQGPLWVRGFLEVAFMSCKLYALQFLTAPDVVAVQRLSLLISIIGGRIFFREEDFGRRFAAGVLILAGVFLVAWMQW
jgi:drug/metabolite transporter (DMT)-like permease